MKRFEAFEAGRFVDVIGVSGIIYKRGKVVKSEHEFLFLDNALILFGENQKAPTTLERVRISFDHIEAWGYTA